MPIPKKVVEAYLAERPEPRTWFKGLKPLEVETELSYINPKPKFRVPFRLDQKICFLLGVAYPETMVMSDLGLGKTAISLELLYYFYSNNFIQKAFVFVPTNELAEGWEDEIKRWGFDKDIPYLLLNQGDSEKKWTQLESFDEGIVIGTYIGIAAMVAKLAYYKKADGKTSDKRKRQVVKELIIKLIDGVDAVVYDQSKSLGNKDSLSFEVAKHFSKKAHIRFSLAGRAFGRDASVLWSQLFLTDNGRALGRSKGLFMEGFFRREIHSYGTKWVQRKRRAKLFAERIAASSIRYSVSECLDLPKKVPPIHKYCTFPDENWEYFDKVRAELLAAKGNYREIKNAFLRLRQISSGFVGFIDDDTGDRAQIEFAENPKLDLLMETLAEIDEDRKVIIYHEFNWSGARICQELTREKYQYGWLRGGTKNWGEIKTRFNTDPEFRVLLLNHKKGAEGLNLQAANYEIFYESPITADRRYECEGRIFRNGQTLPCFYYDLLLRDSVDESILDFHSQGDSLFRKLVEDPMKFFLRKKKS